LFLRSRISAKTCQAGLPARPTDFATSGTSARRNGSRFFLAHIGRDRQRLGGDEFGDLLLALGEHAVVGLDGLGKADIGCGVFVAAEDWVSSGSARSLRSEFPHHLGIAFDHPPTADREQRSPTKASLSAGKK